MSGKYALIIGNTEYIDSGLAQLSAPGKDAEDFAQVLKDQEIGAFDSVNILLNQSSATVTEAIDEFFDQKKQDDLLVLYFSGHGVRDELGALYLAVKNTIRTRLRSTAVKSDFIREAMDQCRSKRQVLILDCCNSGAFAQGTKAATGVSIGTATAFESGFGRIILTASDSTQFAWEGDKVIGETDNSLFTHYLVEGLKGDADNDGDGRITVDELYDYAYEKVRRATPKQTPSKFSSKQQGEIVLRQSTRIEDIKPISLSDQLVGEIESLYPEVRLRAVEQLVKILNSKNLGLVRSAREALEKISAEDDSRRVAQAATLALESFHQLEKKADEERKAEEEAERLALLKIEEERLVRQKAEAERKAKEEAEKLARAQAEREASEREAIRLKAEREAAEKAARESAEKVAKEKAEKEIAEREAANKAEREAMELASRKKAERQEAEKAEREAVELASRRKAEREAKEKAAVAPDRTTKPALRQQPVFKWVIFGIVGLCAVGTGTWGILSYLASLGNVPTPTEAPVTEALFVPTNSSASTEYECTDEIGCVIITPNEPIHIAWIQAVSGAVAVLGQTSVNGGEIAINDKGGELLGHPIQYDGEDSLCNSEGGQTAGTKIAADSTVVAILGTTCSSEARGAMPLISEAGMVMISSSNTNPDLTNPNHSDHHVGYFRTSPNDLFQGRVAAEFAYNELGLRSAATIHDGSPYALSLQQVFADEFTELGGTITAQETINVGDTSFRSVLTQIATSSPDIIYFPIFEPEGNLFADQKCDISGLEITNLMGADGLFTSGFPQATGTCAVGMYLSSPYVGGSKMTNFLSKYDAAFGESPTSAFAPHAYDAMNMIFAAIEQVAFVDTDGTVYIPRQALRDALYNTRNFPGLTGTLACDENGDCGTDEGLGVYQITQAMVNGTQDLVSSIPIWQP